MKTKVLIVDDSLPFLNDAQTVLRSKYDVLSASSAVQCLQILRIQQVAVVLLDLMLPDMNGAEVLSTIHDQIDPHLPVIIVTDHANVENAIDAMRRGAFDFVPKDFNLQLLHARIERALEHRNRILHLSAHVESFAEQNKDFVLASSAMKKVDLEITRLARFDFDVLITGETGAGKDKVAAQLHLRSERRHKPFVPIPLSSLSESLIESELFGHERGAFSNAEKTKIGKFEAANGGTIYFPEISSLSESMQIKLLSFMQYKSIAKVGQDPQKPEIQLDVRLIMATNDLEAMVKRGRIREDFYHRIAGVRLRLPPLRDRLDGVRHLVKFFLKRYDALDQAHAGEEVFRSMESYSWPGNVRELENAVKNALAFAPSNELTIEHFPMLSQSTAIAPNTQDDNAVLPAFKDAEIHFRKDYFTRLMAMHNQSIPSAAAAARLTPQGLRKILATLNIK